MPNPSIGALTSMLQPGGRPNLIKINEKISVLRKMMMRYGNYSQKKKSSPIYFWGKDTKKKREYLSRID